MPNVDFDERPLMKERFLEMGQRIAKTPMDPKKVALWQKVQLAYAMGLQAEDEIMEMLASKHVPINKAKKILIKMKTDNLIYSPSTGRYKRVM